MPICVMMLITSVLTQSQSTPYTHNKWFLMLIAALFAIPLYYITGRTAANCGEKSLFLGIERRTSRVISAIFAAVFAIASLFLAAGLLRTFCELIGIVTLKSTPLWLIALPIVAASTALILKGETVLGRFAHFCLPVVIAILIFGYLLSFKNADFTNLQPFMYGEWAGALTHSLTSLINPFSLVTILLVPLCACADSEKSASCLLKALLIGGGFIVISVLCNILILGENHALSSYFTTYTSFSIIHFSSIFHRLEALIILLLLICCICFIAACLNVATESALYITSGRGTRVIFTAVPLATAISSVILKPTTMSLFEKVPRNLVYLAAVQILLPLLLFLLFKFKKAATR